MVSLAPTRRGIALLLSMVALPASLAAADLAYELQLKTPKLQSLQTSLSPTGGAVAVTIQIQYDIKGGVICTGSVEGAAVTCKGTIKTSASGTSYKFTLRGTTVPATSVSISGVLGTGTAACNYSGPGGRTNVAANPVTIDAVQPVPAAVRLSPAINSKNMISGAARIEAAYGTNSPLAGTIKGKVSSNSVSLLIKQEKRSVIFNGKRMGNNFVGPLRIAIPPAKETIANFAIPAMDVPVASGSAMFKGTLTMIESQTPVPAAGATITLRSDLNGDGKFLGREVLRTVANAQGKFQIKASVVRDRPVLLEIQKTGFAEMLQAYPSVTPGAVIVRNGTFQALNTLEVSAGVARSGDGSLLLDGLPPEIESVQARVFSPKTESAQFPGEFADNQGNLLVSSVFSTVEATDGQGRPVTNLGTNATLCMKVPLDSWPGLGDLTPGNNQIDVPLYYYDEDAGQWKRNASDGWLEDSSRTRIPEGQLVSIRAGTFEGDVFAAGPVTHLSWWNLDWPISTHAGITGIIMGTNGPVQGASISVFGLTYTGRGGPQTTAEDGSFCFEIMRSEGPGEDVDRDGVMNETQQVQITVQDGTNRYSFGPFASPLSPGTCGNGTSLDIGVLTLNGTSLLIPTPCLVTGRVVYSGVFTGGEPSANNLGPGGSVRHATVVGFDTEALDTAATNCSSCTTAFTDSNGYFSLNVPVVSGLTIFAFDSVQGTSGYGLFQGVSTIIGCPSGSVTVEADYIQLGMFGLVLYKGGDAIGSGIILNGTLQVSMFPSSGGHFLGSKGSAAPPTQTGPWLYVLLGDLNDNSTLVGRLDFTVTRVFPAAGTWTLQGDRINWSGTWEGTFN